MALGFAGEAFQVTVEGVVAHGHKPHATRIAREAWGGRLWLVSRRPQTLVPIPYRMAFAGGWIDQPFVSRLNPLAPGSMVVVGLEPKFRFMDRAGMATGTRYVAQRLWQGRLPARDPAELVKELYAEENRDRSEPSGS